jgi:multisite-specific tRNA:(cytosine-C5)-methyltransferase
MLTHQMNRLSTAGVIIINHFAQNFPNLNYQADDAVELGLPKDNTKVLFDRIMCDVPCSSDAAIRKHPQKWEKWSTKDGMGLHPLQIKIALRGFALLKVGGLLSYSTCSLSPIENEAVVAEILRKHKGFLELIDCSDLMKDFPYREGLTEWDVLDDRLVIG